MIDKQIIIDEIRAYIQTAEEMIQPGDLTYREIEHALGYRHDKAQALMIKLCEAGKFRRVEVNGPGYKVVFRRC